MHTLANTLTETVRDSKAATSQAFETVAYRLASLERALPVVEKKIDALQQQLIVSTEVHSFPRGCL
jgi:hypothetical protein